MLLSSVNENQEDTQFHFGFGFTWFDLLAKILHLWFSRKHLFLGKEAIFIVKPLCTMLHAPSTEASDLH